MRISCKRKMEKYLNAFIGVVLFMMVGILSSCDNKIDEMMIEKPSSRSASFSLEKTYQSGSGIIYSVEPDETGIHRLIIKCHSDVGHIRIDWIHVGSTYDRYSMTYSKSSDGYFYVDNLIYDQFEIGANLTRIPSYQDPQLPAITSLYETRGYKIYR